MKKHLLLTISALLLAVGAAFAGVERTSATEYVDKPVGSVANTPLARHIKKPNTLGTVARQGLVAKAHAARAAAKGHFEGLRTYPQISWGEFDQSGRPNILWQTSSRASVGFVLDGKVYAFYNTVSQTYELLSLGLNVFDQATGKLLESTPYSVFDDKDKVVYAAAYNETEGVAYVMTDNGAGSYLMQKYNPVTKAFSLIAKLPGSTAYPMAMAWHPRNNGIYMISDGAYLERFNVSKGAFTRVGDTGLLIDEEEYGFPGAMVYSPKDEAFVALIEQGEAYTGFYTVNPLTGKATATTSLNDGSQWRILICTDTNAETTAPEAPTAVTASFAGASLSGTLEVTLPAATVGGTALSGDVYAVVSEGTTVLSNTVKGAPGAKVSVPLTLTSGAHVLSVAAMIKSGNENLTGPAVKVNVSVGNDVPAAPTNVVLSENQVSWTAPVAANGGFLDVSTLKYNVYINGELVAGSPFTGMKAAITIPTTGNIAKVAAVEAVAGDYVSPRGVSPVWVGRQPYGIPCLIAPLEGEVNLNDAVINQISIINSNNDNRTWIYDEQKEQTGGFYYLCSHDNNGDDWLVLPQMRFEKAGYYRLSLEVWCGSNDYFASDEKFEVGFGREASATGLKVISDVYTVTPKKNFEPYELNIYVATAGNYYIGLHCVSDVAHYRLYARNFLVEAAQGTAAAPAAVTDLKATAAENGALKVNVSFTMPTLDVDGKALAAGASLKAVVSSSEASETVTGAPGQKITTQVAAAQGDNTIAVRVMGEDGATSPASSVELYVGMDVPAYVDLSKVISADNMTATLVWTLPTAGLTGGYVEPSECQYEIYRRSESGSYIKIADAGIGATQWSFTVPAGTAQDIYQFGVRPVNVAGAPDSFAVCDVMLGVLNTLPMKELFRTNGENVINNYDPIGIQNIAEQYCSWAFVNPKDYDREGNATQTALTAYYQGYGQVTFPRFSTVGADNVKISVSLCHDTMSSSEVIIAVVTPDNNFVPLETLDLTQDTGWYTTSVSLPAECLGQGWAGLVIRCYNPTHFHMFMMDGYTIEVSNSNGVALEKVSATGKVRIGSECQVDVQLANYTASSVDVPALKAEFKAESGLVTALTPVAGSATSIARGEKAVVSYKFTAAPEHLGIGFVNVEIADPAKRDGAGTGDARINVVKGYGSYVSDLSASVAGDKVTLSWSDLVIKDKVTEDFEDFNIWERGETLGDFRNLDYDLQTTYGISGVTYPGKYEATAFEIFAGSEFSAAELQAFSGDQYAVAFSPDSRATSPADDWLISPRVAGGSKVEMQILAPSNEFGEETVEVLYSKGGADTSEFETLGTYTTQNMQWQKIEFTLPEAANYFALHYTGFDTFCLMIDDITFVPFESAGTVKAYKVFANGVQIGTTATTTFTTDLPAAGAEYYVVPVLALAGEADVECTRSNVARVGLSGVDDFAVTVKVAAVDGGIVISGFDGAASVYGVDGKLLAAPANVSAETFVAVPAGVYVVAVDGKTYKVAVR